MAAESENKEVKDYVTAYTQLKQLVSTTREQNKLTVKDHLNVKTDIKRYMIESGNTCINITSIMSRDELEHLQKLKQTAKERAARYSKLKKAAKNGNEKIKTREKSDKSKEKQDKIDIEGYLRAINRTSHKAWSDKRLADWLDSYTEDYWSVLDTYLSTIKTDSETETDGVEKKPKRRKRKLDAEKTVFELLMDNVKEFNSEENLYLQVTYVKQKDNNGTVKIAAVKEETKNLIRAFLSDKKKIKEVKQGYSEKVEKFKDIINSLKPTVQNYLEDKYKDDINANLYEDLDNLDDQASSEKNKTSDDEDDLAQKIAVDGSDIKNDKKKVKDLCFERIDVLLKDQTVKDEPVKEKDDIVIDTKETVIKGKLKLKQYTTKKLVRYKDFETLFENTKQAYLALGYTRPIDKEKWRQVLLDEFKKLRYESVETRVSFDKNHNRNFK